MLTMSSSIWIPMVAFICIWPVCKGAFNSYITKQHAHVGYCELKSELFVEITNKIKGKDIPQLPMITDATNALKHNNISNKNGDNSSTIDCRRTSPINEPCKDRYLVDGIKSKNKLETAKGANTIEILVEVAHFAMTNDLLAYYLFKGTQSVSMNINDGNVIEMSEDSKAEIKSAEVEAVIIDENPAVIDSYCEIRNELRSEIMDKIEGKDICELSIIKHEVNALKYDDIKDRIYQNVESNINNTKAVGIKDYRQALLDGSYNDSMTYQTSEVIAQILLGVPTCIKLNQNDEIEAIQIELENITPKELLLEVVSAPNGKKYTQHVYVVSQWNAIFFIVVITALLTLTSLVILAHWHTCALLNTVVVIHVLSSLAIVSGNSVQNFCGSYTVNDWINDLINDENGILQISNPSYTGACLASGMVTYDDGINHIGYSANGIGTTALVLTSGDLNTAARSFNLGGSTTTVNGVPGDVDLNTLTSSGTYDASIIEFDIESSVDVDVTFTYVFASEEYNEYVGSIFNDVFAFWLDNVNVALIDSTVVAINNVNKNQLSEYFVNNGESNSQIKTEYDGLTVALATSIFALTANEVAHVKLAIADAGDPALDSAVFIKPKSFAAIENPRKNEWTIACPCGLISMWYGTNGDFPAGYQLCDGTNGTPDLQG
eukprot:164913_1